MNKIYRLIWNELTQTWVAVTELAKARGKRSHRALSLVSLLPLLILPGVALAQPPPNALPTGGQVVGGQASINQNGATMTIQQGSDRAAINWQDFNIGSQAKVNFQQPSSSAIALNRVLSGNPSQIYGQLNANGQVFLSNSAGVFFAPGSSANVGGLVATTHDMAPSDFMAGSTLFSRNGSTASVVNEGKLTATSGGYIALLAPEVRNHGLVLARKGTAALAAGETFELEFQGRQLTNVRVTPSKVRALVENHQAVEAPGGQIILSAHAANSLQGSVVNSGKIEARGLSKQGGRIILSASGSVSNSGKISANAKTAGNGKAKGKGKSQKNQQLASGQSGSIEINAPKVTNSGKLSATGKKGGKVIITGDDLTLKNGSQIDVSGTHGGGQALIGGDWQGSGDLPQATRVTMEQGASINASATVNGDGGKVVLWSDIHNPYSITYAYGSVTAQGGAEGGNGGQVETSGHEVDIDGFSVNTLAEQGKAGLWLIDPYDYTIDATQASTISNALNGGNVTVTTANNVTSHGSNGNNSSNGDIVVNAAITKTNGNDTTLTLQAANTIAINADIKSTSNKLHVNLQADSDHDGVGVNIVNANIESNGGYVTFGVNSDGLFGGSVYFGRYPSNLSASTHIETKGGNVTINGQVLVANPNGFTIDSRADKTGSNPAAGNIEIKGNIDSANSYQLVNNDLTWEQALVAAKSGSGANVGDTYLATLTSALENAVAGYYVGYEESWLGAERVMGLTNTTLPHTNGETTSSTYNINSIWRWVAGPEGLMNVDGNNGLPFFAQNGSNSTNGQGGYSIAGRYTNWNRTGTDNPEPNNYQADNLTVAKETVLQFTGTAGQWNDLPKNSTKLPYVMETNLAPADLTINAGSTGGGTVTFGGGIGTEKPINVLVIKGDKINFPNPPQVNSSNTTVDGTVYAGGQQKTPVFVYAPTMTAQYGDSISYTATCSGSNCGNYNMNNVTVTPSATVKNVGIYGLTASGLSAQGSDLIFYSSGQLTLNQANLYLTANDVSRVYGDANPTFSTSLTGLKNGDAIGSVLTGSAGTSTTTATNTSNVGTYAITPSKGSYSVTNSNYTLVLQNGTLTITQAPLTVSGVSADNKTYDGATTAYFSGGTLNGLKLGDAVTIGSISGSFSDKNVDDDKPVTVDGISLSGAKAGNYIVTSYPSGLTANITRLNSVDWTGAGGDNNWFNPANWAGYAIPDLANVANVVLPIGVNIQFDTTKKTGLAETGTVQLDSLTQSGVTNAALTQVNGILQVGTGGIQLGALTQTGGSLSSSGDVTLGAFAQTAGTANFNSKLTVSNNFAQTGAGAVAVTNEADITDDDAELRLGNLTAGSLKATSTGGNITQTGGTTLNISATTNLNSGANDIALINANNDFGGNVTASGNNISLKDKDDLTLAATATGNLTTDAVKTTFGATTVTGNLQSTTSGVNTSGGVSQTGAMSINGTASFIANTGTAQVAALDNANNNFVGAVSFTNANNGSWQSANISDNTGGLVFGTVTLGDGLTATSTGGNITQTGVLTIGGASTLTATGHDITLDNDGNDFGGAVTIEGNNISLKDKNDLTVASATASCNLTTESTGNTSFGTANVDGNLTTTSDGNTEFGNTSVGGNLSSDAQGNITQTNGATLTVTGTSELTSGQDITLANDGNDFGGAVTIEGKDISLKDKNDLTVASATASGNLTTESTGNTSFGTANVDGNLTTTSGDNTEFGNTSVGGNLSSDAQGNITQTNGATLTVTGTSELTSGQDITLANDGNDFGGAVTVEGNNISLKDNNDLTLASATASGNLTTDAEKTVFGATSVDGDLQSTTHGVGNNGGVSQSNGATMTVGGTASFIADTGTNQSAALNNNGNNFKDAVSFTATNGASWDLVNIKDDIDGLEFGNVSAGTLAATSTDGAISQTGSSTINVSGTSDLNAGNSDINLGNASNDFGGAVNITGGNVTITDGTGGLTFGNVNASGNMDAESTGGAISQADHTTMIVGGDADIAASNNGQPADITLDNDGNDFGGVVTLHGANVSIKDDTGGLAFGDVNAAGDLDATSTDGDISQTGGGAVNVGGNTNLNSGANDINLGNDNSFGGTVSLAGNDANIKDTHGDLTFGNVTTTGNLDATSTGGNINQASGSTMQVAGDADLTASNGGNPADITLDNDGNDFQGAVSLNGANVAIKDDTGDLVFGDVNAAGDLDVTSTDGNISQTNGSAVNVSGNTNLDSGANDINLGNANNDFGGAVNITGGDVSIADGTGGLTFGNVNAGSLDATSTGGAIGQTGNSTIKVSGTSDLDAGNSDINLGNASNDFGGAVNITGGDVSIADGTGGLTFGNVNAGSLDASSTGGAIGQANGSTMQVTGNSDFTASQGGSPANITLGNTGNDFGGSVSLNGNNASINDDNGGLILGNVTTSGTLDANSTGGDITQTPNTSLAVGGASQFDAHQYNIVLNNQSNDFGGPINSFGHNIAYTNGHGTLTVGNTNASGTLTVLSTSGNILQAGGSLITAQGLAQFTTIAPNSKVVLAANNHFYGGVVYRDTIPDQSPAVPMPTTTPVPVQPLPSMAPAGPTFSSTPNMAGGEVATGFGPESGITIAGDTTTTDTGKTGISVTLDRLPADESQGQVTVVIPQELLMTQDSLSFELPAELTKGLGPDAVISVSLVDGGPLPSWLHFDPRTRTFTAKDVPAGGLPLEVVVTIDGKRTKVTITKSSRA